MKFNPTVKEFLEEKPNLTIIGLWWACTWRFMAVYFGVIVAILILAKIFE